MNSGHTQNTQAMTFYCKVRNNCGRIDSAAQIGDVEETARELLQNQRELLDNLKADYTTYFNKLIDLNAKQLQLIAETETYSELLDKNLLWIRSEAPFFPFDFNAARNTLGWLTDVGNWSGIGDDLWRPARTNPATSTFGVVVLLILVVVQWWLRRRLHEMGMAAAKSYTAPFGNTVRAVLLTLVITAVWPIVLLVSGWRLSTFLSATHFSRAVGVGLLTAGIVYATLEFVRQLCRKYGLAESHFHWKAERVRLVRRHLRWLAIFGLPAVFLLGLIEWDADAERRDTLGRLALVFTLLLLALFFQRVLHPLNATAEGAAHREPNRRQLFFYRATVVLPVAFALFASFGYQHTTWELCWRFVQTVWLLLALLVAQAMALRWLYFARGRLALEQARQRQEAAKQALAKLTTHQSESQ